MKRLVFPPLLITFLLFSEIRAEVDFFQLSLEELMQIEITTANKVAEKLGKIPASVVLVTRRDIQRYGYTSLNEILQHISGIYRINFYDLAGHAHGVRGHLSTGSPNREVIILVNGINRIFDYDSGYYLPDTPVPVEAIDSIEIVRGPQSTVYGSGAFFGVINIITNEVTQQEGTASYASISAGSRQMQRKFARTSYVFEKGNIVANIGTYYDGGFDVPFSFLHNG